MPGIYLRDAQLLASIVAFCLPEVDIKGALLGARLFHAAKELFSPQHTKRGIAMKDFRKVAVSEPELEDLVRRYSSKIEDGLLYVDHQRPTAGKRLDVLMADSGKALVVAELKIVEDDGMLLQGLDYYDFVSTHVDAFARLYKDRIDPTQQARLFLIAPSFSQALVNGCKWLDLPISLFTFNCLKLDGEDGPIPVFTEQSIPAPPVPFEVVSRDGHLKYITDTAVRSKVRALLKEIEGWKSERISIDVIKYSLSIKIDGHVFAYLSPRRKFYIIGTFDADDEWKDYPIKSDDDLTSVKPIIRAAMERRMK